MLINTGSSDDGGVLATEEGRGGPAPAPLPLGTESNDPGSDANSAPSFSKLPTPTQSTLATSLPTNVPPPNEQSPPLPAPPAADLRACICDLQGNCTDIVYSIMSICISLGGERQESTPLNQTLREMESLDIVHPETSTLFQVITPFTSSAGGGAFSTGTKLLDTAKSPWASVFRPDRKRMIIHVRPGGLQSWFDEFMGSEIEVVGRVQIEEDQGTGGNGKVEGAEGSSRSLSTLYFTEEFSLSATLVSRPSLSPSEPPSWDIPSSIIRPCVCDTANNCIDGFVLKESQSEIRLCFTLGENGASSVVKINRFSIMTLEQVGGTQQGFPFDVIDDRGGKNAVSPLATIYTGAFHGEEVDDRGISKTVPQAVVSIDIRPFLPMYFVSPSPSPLHINGVAEVMSPSENLPKGESIPWELVVEMDGTRGDEGPSPANPPRDFFTVQACRCNKDNTCVPELEPLLKIIDDDITPELRVCINAINDKELSPSIFKIASFKLIHDIGGYNVETQYGRQDRSSLHTIVVIVEKTAPFFDQPLPLPSISVEGSVIITNSDEPQEFTVMVPLAIETEDKAPSPLPSLHNFPSLSSFPSYVLGPSDTPSIFPTASQSIHPSSSSLPSVTFDPGITACVCDAFRVCKQDQLFSENNRELLVCLRTRPSDLRFVSGFALRNYPPAPPRVC